ncbi:ParB/RepB/Spo0J family partition protein [Jiella marina]|uniref:ParB/RepB/Spo0J family partition protein n=1 Tax=Jiella sp. LLJ827 TaxID=2917712 RepID=UPI002101C4B3|nr:ParB/RepB/Spo0J family partition protein [Jiella sp. LLJ827]MCQ0986991.1 ParB/RepB/Spo0J family partition protein [Jiella sp. LLJ827]
MSEDRSRQRLGRGLASLIGAGVAAPARPVPGFDPQPAAPTIQPERSVPIDRIAPNPHNPRRVFNQAELDELAASIRQHGVVQPLLVRPQPGQRERFEIVAGERRWRAAGLAGLAEVPVVMREINDRQSLEIAIIENVQRADLNAIEEAQGYQTLIDEHGYTQADLAEILGKSRSHVANTLRLLKLPPEVRAMVEEGALSAGAARTVVTAEDPVALAQRIVKENLSVREAEALARDPEVIEPAAGQSVSSGRGRAARETKKSEEILDWERRLGDAVGHPVAVSRTKGGGVSVELSLSGPGDVENLLQRLQDADSRAVRHIEQGPRLRSV